MPQTIDRRRLPLNSLRAFEAAARHMSFTRAADSLGVTQSAISRHILNLEEVVGTQLFDRRGSALALTKAGRDLLDNLTPSFDRLQKSLNAILGHDRGGMLRIALPISFAHQFATPIIEACRVESRVRIEIETLRDLIDLDQSEHDVAVVFSRPRVTDVVMDLLWMEELTLLCRPDAIIRGADGTVDLAAMVETGPILHIRNAGGRHYAWQFFQREAGLGTDVSEGVVFDTAQLASEFAQSEGGLLVADRRLLKRALDAGQLVAPVAITTESGFGYFMLFRPEDMQREAVQHFRALMLQRFGAGAAGGGARAP